MKDVVSALASAWSHKELWCLNRHVGIALPGDKGGFCTLPLKQAVIGCGKPSWERHDAPCNSKESNSSWPKILLQGIVQLSVINSQHSQERASEWNANSLQPHVTKSCLPVRKISFSGCGLLQKESKQTTSLWPVAWQSYLVSLAASPRSYQMDVYILVST